MTGLVKHRWAAWSAFPLFTAGIATLIGWRFGWQQLMPRLQGAIPMPMDAGVAFLLAALNLFLLRRGRAASFRIGSGLVFAVGGLGLICLSHTEVPGHVNQMVFQRLGFYIQGPYPHILLAAGLEFAIWGVGLICLTRLQKRFCLRCALTAGICGTLMVTLGTLCLLIYVLGIPEQESEVRAYWLFRMATESAFLFIWMGAVLCGTAWKEAWRHANKRQPQIRLAAGFTIGAGLSLMFVVVNMNLSLGLEESLQLRAKIAQNFFTIKNVAELVAAVREAESGQRGFLLTNADNYLESYRAGLQRLDRVQAQDLRSGGWRSSRLNRLIDTKMSELAHTVQLAQNGHYEEALATVKTGRGMRLMAEIEQEAARTISVPEHSLSILVVKYQQTVKTVRNTINASYGLAFLLLLCTAYLFWKEIQRRAEIEQALRVHETELETKVEERTAELQTSERRYRAMLEQAPFAVHILDRDGNSASVNPQFEQFFGVDSKVMQGYNIWADPQPARQGTIELLQKAFAGESGFSGVIRHDPVLSANTALACSGVQPIWVEVYVYPVKSQEGEVQEVVLFCKDVTSRELALAAVRESESYFRELTNTLPQIVWTETADGVVDYYNDRWYEFTGFPRDVEQSWYPVLHPDDLEFCLKQRQIAQANKSCLETEIRLWDQSRNCYRWYLVRSVAVLTPSGEVRRWIGTSTDIQDKKEAEELLEQRVRARTAELEESYRLLQSREEVLRHSLAERDTLFREVHHRVKNNLQVISSLLHMHSRSLINQPIAKSALEEARRRVLSMAMIHERLYAHQKMDRINFGEYTETLVRALMRFFVLPDQNIETRINAEQLDLDIEQAIPCGLILNELITNALKYAFKDRSSGLITVALSQTEGCEILLVVTDDGIGLPEGFNWRKSKSMGLPIVDILAKQLDGRAEVESGNGLKVTVRFPQRVLSELAA